MKHTCRHLLLLFPFSPAAATSGSDASRDNMPLPPELWNLTVVVAVCALMVWLARLMRLLLTFADVRYAISSNAVLHIRDLGVSLHVLQSASMWHFQQLLRTNSEAEATKMDRIQMRFEIPPSSISIERVITDGPLSLKFRVRSRIPYSAQVLWSVRSEALEGGEFTTLPHSVLSPTMMASSPRNRHAPTALARASIDRTVRAVLNAPMRLTRIRRQSRRHELHDESSPSDRSKEALPAFESVIALPFTQAAYSSQSQVWRCDKTSEGGETISFSIPSSAMSCPAEELRSLIEEADNHSPTSLESPNVPTGQTAASLAPRFAAVIVVSAGDSHPEQLSPAGKLSSSGSPRCEEIVCQCIALDFLPTPLKPEKVSPAIVKKCNFSQSGRSYVVQEIYGRDSATSGECTICLEGALSVVLLPCRHFCVCRVCLEEIDRCPICRAKFSTYVCYDAKGSVML